ncbi:hypothetical protein XELAEV_18030716mg [Xenopus laevis]|uniref:Uncharacterized protein n=1 Tax=Xenopus laevis TaxID=8355 RepID=A0A974CL98_XENLA|nr:hypothetical protein XELAEV_18030716mg [Xenopus laevis]
MAGDTAKCNSEPGQAAAAQTLIASLQIADEGGQSLLNYNYHLHKCSLHINGRNEGGFNPRSIVPTSHSSPC